MKTWDAIVVGAGHNGLGNACSLQRAGLDVLVVEKNDWVGGAATSRELTPGWLYSNCSYVCSLFRPEIMRDLELPRFGLQVIAYEGGAVFTRDGDYLANYRDHDAHRREFARFTTDLFTKRRKQLGTIFGRQREQWPSGVTPDLRPEALSPQQVIALWKMAGPAGE